MAEREAELDEVYGWFREQVASSFGFLVDEFGCGAKTQDEGGDGIFTRFSNRTTAVEVSYEPTDDVVEVFIIKLVNGSTPAYLDSWQWNWVPLSRYLVQIGRSGTEEPNRVPWGDRRALQTALQRQARALRQHAEAPLRGDFSVFDEAKAPQLREDQLYEMRAPADTGMGEDELRQARSFPVQLGAWTARRLGRLVRRE
jgi:hypothetical protein